MWQAGAIFRGEWENFHVGMYVTANSSKKSTSQGRIVTDLIPRLKEIRIF